MNNGLAGRRVLVTAAGGGIGRACAELFATSGADVLATDLNGAHLNSLEGVRTALLDATDRDAVHALIEAEGRIDSVVHCVGVVPSGRIADCTVEEWRETFRVNVDSFLNVAQAVLPRMTSAGAGSLTCIASVVSSLKGAPDRAAYGASKAAMIGMVKSIAVDYARSRIRCNAVCPGTVLSPSLRGRIADLSEKVGAEAAMSRFVDRQPLGRLGRPEEIAALCVYLASDLGAFVTGQALVIDGGMSV